ncbi:MAG: D-lysine 5,6-aminomutase subunit alpha [Bdellovibrionales bacterium RIFOXYB1_FULL_37_110]|nr:MAG: D-lysine 5,6-aminomutase subunit alpha [Bdellovibrionales bacterium RIFOXYC1_FULL_37_79]OFZ58576.1 MAG: D-lysine 5,6-aminomutase subunit alpha [Bdellovibrionales bacterium RIFOXYB1_FULL_37_110]OFZ61762.1 MAG: D-lysine 5,6-aminomutase subunit alpha [Bdellovibrionales bacterium RIFOXYD1_FULL_36_51]
MAKINLDKSQVETVKTIAKSIADDIQKFVDEHSTESVERTVLRLYGVDGVDEDKTPLPNKIIEKLLAEVGLNEGVSKYFAKAMVLSKRDGQTTAELLDQNHISFKDTLSVLDVDSLKIEKDLSKKAIHALDNTYNKKLKKQIECPVPPTPWKYLIVATGNIYEDRVQAESAVDSGADIIAVIRSTAQSLLDYIPYGATTEGFGGTYATQENFKIMRKALDKSMKKRGRYVRLVNYSSGLCMSEIAACAAMEDLDMLLNDSMYGILFRDINMKRTFVDQYMSRLICSRANIIINTGEDNYLTTSDAIESAHTVTASQLINEAMGINARLKPELLGLGHAYEINPTVENAFLYELAHAQLARELFPRSPLKYMPPTKYKKTDIFFSHAMDTMFNLASITTNQGIHLAGILTEAIHTPLMQDRYQALDSINYVFNIAKNLGDEIEFKAGGFIENRAKTVLNETEQFLIKVEKMGLMTSISNGLFAGIKRPIDGGKGGPGVIKKAPTYSNPIMDELKKGGKHDQ